MARVVDLHIKMVIEGGREVRQVSLDENLRLEAKHLVTRLRTDYNYNIVRGSVEWESQRTDGRGFIQGIRKRFMRKSLVKAPV